MPFIFSKTQKLSWSVVKRSLFISYLGDNFQYSYHMKLITDFSTENHQASENIHQAAWNKQGSQ